jgi:TolB protein
MDLDGLLTEAQGLDLETHLRECETCHADSESFAALTRRLHTGFHSRWDAQDGPSENMMKKIHSQSRRIHMQKRIDFAFNILGGVVTLLVLFFVLTSVISQFQKKATSVNGTQTGVAAFALQTDNRLIAFTSAKDGNLDIYTMRADGSDLTNLTNNPAQDVNPHWSPDGKHIAFESDRDGFMQIYFMNAYGSNVVQLTDDPADHESSAARNFDPWSPDGSKLIFLEKDSGDEKSMLYVMDSNGHNRIALVDEPGMYRSLTWSPDGKHIAFLSLDSQDQTLSHIYVVSTDGSKLTEITKALPAEESLESYFAGTFDWSRDGQSIFFIASNTDAVNNGITASSENYEWKAYEASLDGVLTLKASARSPIRSWWQGTYFITPLMGPGGWTWVYADGTFNTINPTKDCKNELLYDSNSKNASAHAVANYSQSPNGNGVIIASCPDGEVNLSWVNSAGTEFAPLLKLSTAPLVESLTGTQWSQDDKFLAFTITTGDKTEMYLLNLTESKRDPSIRPAQVLLGDGRLSYPSPSWQPVSDADIAEEKPAPEPEKTSSHNRLLAFTSEQDGNPEIYTVHADGSGSSNLTNDSANDNSPAWSPDGQKIAFTSERSGISDIFVMNPDGSDVIPLTDNTGYDGFFTWSPNGQKIVYLASSGNDSNFAQLMVMDSDGNNKVSLTESGSYIFLGWSPNGQKIVYQKQYLEGVRQDNELHVLNIDGTDHHEWNSIIDKIKWTDEQHFIGYGPNGDGENPEWLLSQFNVNGDPSIELASHRSPIVALFDKTYIVEGTSALEWYSTDGSQTPLQSYDLRKICGQAGDWFLEETGHTLSPDETRAFVTVHCSEGNTWFYLESADGSQFVQFTSFTVSNTEQLIGNASWSPDGQYVTITIASRNGRPEDIYLFDIQKMLNDPSAEPIQLTSDGAMKYGIAWQPIP